MEFDGMTILGYILAFMGSVAFVPQIQMILKSKSGEGLDLVMFSIADFVTALVTSLCLKSGLDISNWLEVLITNIQVFTIHALARYYLHQPRQLSLLLLAKLLYILLLTAAPLPWIKFVMNCLLPVVLVERGGAVYKHYKNKSTGQLSGATLGLQWTQFAGRIFTSVMAGAEGDFVAPMVLNFFFGTVILGQWIWYRRGKGEKKE
ncbi:hypothetical protein ACHWQZ_G015948 [Mnemiopsis leidyi]